MNLEDMIKAIQDFQTNMEVLINEAGGGNSDQNTKA